MADPLLYNIGIILIVAVTFWGCWDYYSNYLTFQTRCTNDCDALDLPGEIKGSRCYCGNTSIDILSMPDI